MRLALPSLLFLAPVLIGSGVAAPSGPHVLPPDDSVLLFLDSRAVDRMENARLAPGAVFKDPANPLFKADQPWENALNNLYPNVLWDESTGSFRLWYKCVLADPEVIAKMDGPSTVHDVGWYLLHATSRDGLVWEKPGYGIHRFAGNAATNIVARDTPNVGVFRDDHERDPARRYKMTYDVGLGQPRARFSQDGLHWSGPVEMIGFHLREGDTHNNAFWDERSGRYVWFTKYYSGERTVARLESQDFLHWTDTGVVLRSSVEEGKATQTYALTAFRYGSVYLGYVMMYHPGTDRSVDCELAWSPDGRRWSRVAPGQAFIPRGPAGSYDSLCIYGPAGPVVTVDNQVWIWYGGSDVPHTGWKRHCLPCLARLPLDHFAGIEPESSGPAVLESALLQPTGEPLELTADAAGGTIRVVALDAAGKVIDESGLITSDVVRSRVPWKRGGFEAGRTPVKLRFEFERSRLYAVRGATLLRTEFREAGSPFRGPGWTPRPVMRKTFHFDQGTEGCRGVDSLGHRLSGGWSDSGHVRIAREGTSAPIFSTGEGGGVSVAGAWPEILGGRGARLQARVRRVPQTGFQWEIFAKDIAQWTHAAEGPAGEGWTLVTTALQYGWTDAEAMAAGWRPARNAFSWAETMAHVGKVVLLPSTAGAQEWDLDELVVEGLPD